MWAGSKGTGHLPTRNTPGDLTISTPRKQGCLEKEKKGGAPSMMETRQENTQASLTRPQTVTTEHHI